MIYYKDTYHSRPSINHNQKQTTHDLVARTTQIPGDMDQPQAPPPLMVQQQMNLSHLQLPSMLPVYPNSTAGHSQPAAEPGADRTLNER